VFQLRDGAFLPSANGDYVAYDLSWELDGHIVALQYVGSEEPGGRDMRALMTYGVDVVTVTDDELCDIGAKLHDVGLLLGLDVPSSVGEELMRLMPSQYANQRMLFREILTHKPAGLD
jgi:hypothetical protein